MLARYPTDPGVGGTQTTGYIFGLGQTDTYYASGGGGYYGGKCRLGVCGGGSGYIGGVTGGSMTNGVQTGNGKAIITLVSIN